jgi:hypothetical protein
MAISPSGLGRASSWDGEVSPHRQRLLYSACVPLDSVESARIDTASTAEMPDVDHVLVQYRHRGRELLEISTWV